MLVWNLATTPQFYVFGGFGDVEAVVAPHAQTASWARKGKWFEPVPSKPEMVDAHLGAWDRIVTNSLGHDRQLRSAGASFTGDDLLTLANHFWRK